MRLRERPEVMLCACDGAGISRTAWDWMTGRRMQLFTDTAELDWRWLAGLSAAAAIAATVDITLAVGLGGVIIGLLLARAFTPAREDRANDDPPTDARVYNLDALVSVIETPAVAFDSDLSVAAFNTLALDLYPSIEPGLPLSRISRHPEFLGTLPLVAADGLPRSGGNGRPFACRTTLARWHRPLVGSSCRCAKNRCSRAIPRSFRAGPAGANAVRLHRQRLARVENAARVAEGLHRNPARIRKQR